MGKLNASLLRYLNKEDFRILTSVSYGCCALCPVSQCSNFQVEMGMKNHALVPGSLVGSIAGLKCGGVHKKLENLCQHRLLAYEKGKKCKKIVDLFLL